ncbi:MAG: hypothetical protein ACRBCL_04800 [Maritimibacter sp.]
MSLADAPSDPVVINVDFSTVPMMDFAVAILRANRRKRDIAATFGALFVGSVLGALLVLRFGPLNYDLAFFRLTVPIIGALIAALIVMRRQSRRHWDSLQNCAFYKTPVTLRLDHDGIRGMEFVAIPWRVVNRIAEIDEGIALQYTPMHYVPIMDNALPEGMDRAALIARIEAWRA